MLKEATILIVAATCLTFACSAAGSGYRSPEHSQLTYSFTCAGGGSGHATYHRKGAPSVGGTLTLWVNGQYIHSHSAISSLMGTHNLETISASCEDGRVAVFLTLWHVEKQQSVSLTAHVDEQGEATITGP